MDNKSTRTVYHTELKLLYKAGLLSSWLIKKIPRSTLHDWKNSDLSHIYGKDYSVTLSKEADLLKLQIKHKKLHTFTIAIFKIAVTISNLFSQVHNAPALLKSNIDKITKTITSAADSIGKSRAIKFFNISYSKFYSLRTLCTYAPFNLCSKKHPLQLTGTEISNIKLLLINPEFSSWSVSSLWCQAIREKMVTCSLTTWYRYAHALKLMRRRIKKKRYTTGIRGECIFQILHMDVTVVKTKDGLKSYVYFIQDNFSRAILGWKAAKNVCSKVASENLKEVCTKYNLFNRDVELITDGGSENLGEVTHFLSADDLAIKHLKAGIDIQLSDSMVEALNKTVKYYFLFRREINDHLGLINALEEDVPLYMNRPLVTLNTLTPNEVLNGEKIPEKLYDIGSTRQIRINTNRNNGCGVC